MTYTNRNWLYSFTDTNKTKTFTYTWNNDKTLAAMQYPNQTMVTQTWYKKMLDTVTVTKGEDTYLDIDSTFNNLDKISSYEYSVYAGQGQTFSESYAMEYDNLNRISELTFGSNSKELTYAYDQGVGKLTSITDSLLNDSYDFSYDSKERLSTVTYPGVQGTSSFTYDDLNDKGRLEQVAYPGNKTMTFTWDSRDRITSIVLDDTSTEIEYALEYNDAGKIKSILHYEDDVLLRTWNASYGLYGIEKIVAKNSLNQIILTQDFTTDPNGTILSMTYTPTQGFGGSFTGEAYYYYNPCTDTMVRVDPDGNPIASYAVSRSSGHVTDTWNPGEIVDIIAITGTKGPSYTLPGFGDNEIILPWRPNPGYGVALVDAEFAIDIGSIGATASTSTSDCGTAQPCGGETICNSENKEQCYQRCRNRCFSLGGVSAMEATKDKAILNFDNEITKATPGSFNMTDEGMKDKYTAFNNVAENIEIAAEKLGIDLGVNFAQIGVIVAAKIVAKTASKFVLGFLTSVFNIMNYAQALLAGFAITNLNAAYDAWYSFKEEYPTTAEKGFCSLWNRRKECKDWCWEKVFETTY
ncbi:MAG: hypothetical protein PHD83_02945, partial [Caldisericia bacterium]|nr:hypothetical protein [Caldisericia bacterium]